jgi:hypothetical protein
VHVPQTFGHPRHDVTELVGSGPAVGEQVVHVVEQINGHAELHALDVVGDP